MISDLSYASAIFRKEKLIVITKVNTVLGAIEADDIGVTLVHEHLCVGLAGWNYDAFSLPYNRTTMTDVCTQALNEAKDYGLNTLVDVTQ